MTGPDPFDGRLTMYLRYLRCPSLSLYRHQHTWSRCPSGLPNPDGLRLRLRLPIGPISDQQPRRSRPLRSSPRVPGTPSRSQSQTLWHVCIRALFSSSSENAFPRMTMVTHACRRFPSDPPGRPTSLVAAFCTSAIVPFSNILLSTSRSDWCFRHLNRLTALPMAPCHYEIAATKTMDLFASRIYHT